MTPEVPNSVDMEAYVELMAATLGLSLPNEIRAGVVANVEHIFAIAQPVITFPLPDTVESAAAFEP